MLEFYFHFGQQTEVREEMQKDAIDELIFSRVVPSLSKNKYHSSLMIPKFKTVSGLQIYNYSCELKFMPDQMIKQAFDLSLEDIRYLKNQLNFRETEKDYYDERISLLKS